MDVSEHRRQLPQKGGRYGTVGYKSARLPVGRNLPFDNQIFFRAMVDSRLGKELFQFFTVLSTEKIPETRARASPLRTISADARAPRSRLSESTTMDFPLPVSPESTFRPCPKLYAGLFDYRIVLDHQFDQHVTEL